MSSILIIYPNAPLAQLAEQMILDHWVVGSNPTWSAKLNIIFIGKQQMIDLKNIYNSDNCLFCNSELKKSEIHSMNHKFIKKCINCNKFAMFNIKKNTTLPGGFIEDAYITLSIVNGCFIGVSNVSGYYGVNKEKDNDLFCIIKNISINFDFNIIVNNYLKFLIDNDLKPFKIENTYNDLKSLMNDYIDFFNIKVSNYNSII